MPELLVELFSEEIPARFQRRAAEDFRKAVTDALVEAGLVYQSAGAFVTPRRLALTVVGLPARSPDTREQRKGPRVGSPQQAIDGFLKAAGLSDIGEARVESGPKGEFYVASIERKGAAAPDLIAAILLRVIGTFPWPKSMRWGSGTMSWVRPLRAVTATFGAENEEPQVIPFAVDGVDAGQTTFGHRFLAPQPIRVRRFDDYAQSLERAKVVIDLDRRKDIIRNDAEHLAFAAGLQLIADEGLLEEVAGLVEWPVVMMGSFDEAFLAVPEQAIIATIRANQKCFCLRDPRTGKLASRFVLTANTIAADGGATIVAGNERVIRARLSDAKFFYEADLKVPLETLLPQLGDSVFHARLGTQAERVARLESLAAEIAPKIGADPAQAVRAARLAKADLVTQMVGEFPELQGTMGRYYAAAQGEPAAIADAIAQHYRPLGPTDRVPGDPVAITVALADKLDLLTGFWSINEKPTGSRDPFALRRAALGVIRIIIDNKLKFPLAVEPDLLAFFHDRLKVMLRDNGARHDLVDAVITETSDDMLQIAQRVEALSGMLGSEDGKNLLAGYRRAVNIVAVEEKKDGTTYGGDLELGLLRQTEEVAMARAIEVARAGVTHKLASDNYADAIAALASLRGPVDAFFDAQFMVNDPDPAIRRNRLRLLSRLRDTMHQVADFSKIAG